MYDVYHKKRTNQQVLFWQVVIYKFIEYFSVWNWTENACSSLSLAVSKQQSSVWLRTLLFGVLFLVSDGVAKENGKKAIGLDWQNNNFACASCFFVHFFAVTARP